MIVISRDGLAGTPLERQVGLICTDTWRITASGSLILSVYGELLLETIALHLISISAMEIPVCISHQVWEMMRCTDWKLLRMALIRLGIRLRLMVSTTHATRRCNGADTSELQLALLRRRYWRQQELFWRQAQAFFSLGPAQKEQR